MNFKSYPIKFEPILKSKIWGGERLNTILNKSALSDDTGESWEISGVKGDVSIIANGPYKNQSLLELLETSGNKVLGSRLHAVFGTQFPLLIKYIDAKQDLSIQLHPNDELAARRHNSFGKTEMWYVMQAEERSNLIVGFNQKMNAELYSKHLQEKSLAEIMNFIPVSSGDTFFIEVGRVHAIGAGVLLAEIQQTSDITYRVYDWDRVDANGNRRELHNDLAIDAIDFDMPDDFKVDYTNQLNSRNSMVECPYFKTGIIPVSGTLTRINTFDSFIIYMCVEGEVELIVGDFSEFLKMGETVLIPASASKIVIKGDQSKLLEVYT